MLVQSCMLCPLFKVAKYFHSIFVKCLSHQKMLFIKVKFFNDMCILCLLPSFFMISYFFCERSHEIEFELQGI
jgi:hypothetical protein